MELNKKIKTNAALGGGSSGNSYPLMLMVDDSKTMRKAAEKMLGKEFKVITAVDGEDGWKVIQENQNISVVFTDLNMPEMDGFELLKCIRESQDEGISGLPVIIVTGKADDEVSREKALNMGATDFIGKPFNSTDLLARARSNSNYQRLQRKLAQESIVDPITGLYNAVYFSDRIKKDLAFCQRHGHVLSILKVEVFAFKELFLKHGKAAANEIIKQVADVLRERFRKEDTISRLSLTQFAVSLPSGQHEGAMALAHGLNSLLDTKNITTPTGEKLGLIISVSTPKQHPGLTARSLLEEIDVIHIQALHGGKGTVLSDKDLRKGGGKGLPSEVQAPVADKLFDEQTSQLSVDKALRIISQGSGDKLTRHVNGLIRKIIPLLRLAEKPIREELIEQLKKEDK